MKNFDNLLKILTYHSEKIDSETFVNKFILNFSKDGSEDLGNLISNSTKCIDWLLESMSYWENKNIVPSNPVKIFTVYLATELSRTEVNCDVLKERKVYERMMELFNIDSEATTIEIQSTFLKLMRVLLKHKGEFVWIINTVKQLIEMCFRNFHKFPLEGQENLAYFIEKLLHDKQLSVQVMFNIMAPLSAENCDVYENGSQEYVFINLLPQIKIVGFILRQILENSSEESDIYLGHIVIKFKLKYNIHRILKLTHDKEIIFWLCKILVLLELFEVCLKFKNKICTSEDMKETLRIIMEIYKINITRGNPDTILEFSCFGINIWKKMCARIPSIVRDFLNLSELFLNQQLCLQTVPIFAILFQFCNMNQIEKMEQLSLFRRFHIEDVFSLLEDSTVKLGTIWIQVLESQDSIFPSSTKALQHILHCKMHFDKKNAILLFQKMLYVVQDITSFINSKIEVLETCLKEVDFFMLLLEAIIIIINDFSITWKISVQSVSVTNVTFDFLMAGNWDPKIVVKALKLMNISIAKYMAPNLALLVDRTSDSNMALISPLLYAKLHDSSWEVRDSALEVLCTISNLSNTKFPSFQKIVLETELPTLVVKMAMNDGQTFVRATALKCLLQMIEVSGFWDGLLKLQNLPENMIQILHKDPEGLVRKEAAALLCGIYQHQGFSEDILPQIYEIMIYSATKDLHWEVEIEALKFWEIVIKNQLHNQGMIDGTFPTVTFSKENRKIVTLTETEISKRLQKTLVHLSEMGCLGVLVAAIQHDDDIEVSKAAINITQNYLSILRNYNINATNVANSIPQSPVSDLSNSPPLSNFSIQSEKPSTSKTEFSEEVMDQIINSSDTNLLQNVYSPSISSPSVSSPGSTLSLNCKKVVTPSEFLLFTSQDLDQLINERKKWLRGIDELGSLLDDMLKNYSDEEVNSMDCY